MQINIDARCLRKIISGVRFRSGIKVRLTQREFEWMLPGAEGFNNMAAF